MPEQARSSFSTISIACADPRFAAERARRDALFDPVERVAHCRERVAKIVGDARGELTDGGELFVPDLRLARALELGLHQVAFGHVAADDHDRRLAGEDDPKRRGVEGDLRAVLLDEALLAGARAGAGRGDAKAELRLGAIGREDEVAVASTDELTRVGVPERFEEGAVRVDEAVLADDRDAVG